MYDPVVPVSLSRCAKIATWSAVVLLVAGVWIAFWAGDDDLRSALGFTGAPLSAVAATVSIRCYFVRMSRLIRTAHGLTPPDAPRVLRRVD